MILDLYTSILGPFELVNPRLKNCRGRCITQRAIDLVWIDNNTIWAKFVKKLGNDRGRATCGWRKWVAGDGAWNGEKSGSRTRAYRQEEGKVLNALRSIVTLDDR
jgi:hypothetical protein